MKLTEEELLAPAVRGLVDRIAELESLVHLAKPLAESAVAPGECVSVPDEQAEFELFHTNKYGGVTGGFRDGHYIYAPVQARWEAWQARAALGMQPPNNQPNSDHVAEPIETSTDTSLTADRELLELAAKAAGITLSHWDHERKTFSPVIGVAGTWWNPLTDDGDALRLAVRLGLGNRVLCLSIGGQKSACEFNYVAHGSDACAATRRAIVRAAAAIQSGISSPTYRPNEKDAVQEGKQ